MPNMVGPFDRWWVRILLSLSVICVSAVVGISISLDPSAMMLTLYGTLGVSIIGIELLRPGGSAMSSGLGISIFTVRQIIGGIGGALLILGLIVSFALAMGGSMVVSTNGLIAAEIGVLVVASAGEEFLFRGTIFEAIRERFGVPAAVGIMSGLFGAAHLMNPSTSVLAIVNVTLAGFLLSAMVIRTQSLWMSISFHVAWNCCVRIFVGSVSGTQGAPMISTLDVTGINPGIQWLVGGNFGIEEGAMTTLFLVAGVVIIYALIRPDRFVRAARLRLERATTSEVQK